MIFDGYLHQLPDTDPTETLEWLDSLDAVIDAHGKTRARYLLSRLLERARASQVSFPATVSTDYVNTIPREHEPWFPGDEHIERRIRAFIRWNAAAMVIRANKKADGIGGHLSTFASSASLYEIGFNHFFRGKDDGNPGDHIHIQGHAAPGMYARAFLEGRLTDDDLDHFRREVGRDGLGLSSYPHPRLMPEFWEFPTVSMGLGPISAIYQARFNRYLHNRQLDDTSASRVWAFLGDGETDEPETLGALSLASREQLDNLVFVVNCNLQRLDGPVRGNGKIIQELEATFRGAGWNVIKVIWGSKWDELLLQDKDGVLLNKMNTTVDGEFQRYSVETGQLHPGELLRAGSAAARDGRQPLRRRPAQPAPWRSRLPQAVRRVPRGDGEPGLGAADGDPVQDDQGLDAGFGSGGSQRDAPDQEDDRRPDARPARAPVPHRRDPRRGAGGRRPAVLPAAVGLDRVPVPDGAAQGVGRLDPQAHDEGPPGDRAPRRGRVQGAVRRVGRAGRVDHGQLHPAAAQPHPRPAFGTRVVPIIPDEARTFGMDSLFREIKIYASQGQKYEPVDHDLLLSYTESVDGQILEEGITEAGAMASFIAAATAYSTRGVPMVPFYTFYSMFGFQRVGDLIWQAADARSRGFLLGATAGRTTLLGEGLQHQDGHSLVLASTVPPVQAYDPAYAYEVATIVKHGIERMYGGTHPDPDVFYYLTLYNENYTMPAKPGTAQPDGATVDDGIIRGLYRWQDAPAGKANYATVLFSGSAQGAARDAAAFLAEHYDIGVDLWSATSYKLLREDALAAERWNRLHPSSPEPRVPLVATLLGAAPGPIVAVTDFMKSVPDQVARFLPGRTFIPLGTDGMGRSDTREVLRAFFEIDMPNVVLSVLSGLAAEGKIGTEVVADAITRFELDPERADPYII